MWQKIKNIYHLFCAIIANIYFGFPGKKLIVIGVTGTDGKTTTVNLIYHILKTSHISVSMISTIGAIIHGKKLPLGFHVTTPSSWKLQKFLKDAVTKYRRQNYLVLEVTSHAIDQYRIWGIPFTISVLTNITSEHLDYHNDYKTYAKTKAILLKNARIAIINKDDISYNIIQQELKSSATVMVKSYSLSTKADVTTRDVPVEKSFLGDINSYNLLAAVSVCKVLQIKDKYIKKGIETFQLPVGRQEIVFNKNFTIMIDFAHTPYAFHTLLSSLRPKIKGRLIHVFGSAGLRDKSKRPEMGKISSLFSDIMILTAEDPRTEDVNTIIEEIQNGISPERKNKITVCTLSNRQEAITKAISLAKKDDFIVITGKAHEQTMNYGNGEEQWNEYKAVKKSLQVCGVDYD
jgi:UDP-N-acetylmuramoyl-L-alanyl-D-glutamate--2,6-diaminopimelate ligase